MIYLPYSRKNIIIQLNGSNNTKGDESKHKLEGMCTDKS